VVLPLPDKPTIPTLSPLSIFRLKPSKSFSLFGYAKITFLNSISAFLTYNGFAFGASSISCLSLNGSSPA
jgi:hypothetical protein